MNTTPDQPAVSPKTSEPAVAIPPRFRWLKRGLLTLLFLIVALGIVRWQWGVYAERRLQKIIDEVRSRGEPILIEDFKTHTVPDEENAAFYLQKAAMVLQQPAGTKIDIGIVAGDAVLIEQFAADVKLWMEGNAEARELIKRGCECQQADWGVRLKSPVISMGPMFGSAQRMLAQFACTESLYEHQCGNDAEAVEACGRVLRIGEAAGQTSPLLLTAYVATAIDALGSSMVEDLAPQLQIGPKEGDASATTPASRAQVEELIALLLDESAIDTWFRDGLCGERMVNLDILNAFGTPGGGLVTGKATFGGPLVWLLKPSFQLDTVFMIEQTDGMIAAMFQPNYAAAEAAMPEYPSLGEGSRQYAHVLSSTVYSSWTSTPRLRFRTLLSRRFAATALALRLYEVEHGRRPATLDELVPEYLPAVPIDPFAADGRTIGYLPNADPPVLYSVGEDGVDGGGHYEITERNSINSHAGDLVFFLNGDRPRNRADVLKHILKTVGDDPNDGGSE